MRFKAFEICVGYGDHNSSMVAIEKAVEKKVDIWLIEHPKVHVHSLTQSLADVNGSVVCQIGLLYSEA